MTSTLANDRVTGLGTSAAIKAPCRVATTANLSELAGLLTIDGLTVSDGMRVLVKDQSTATENGIYIASTGLWRRARDCQDSRDLVTGTRVYVTGGASGPAEYRVTTADPILVGSSSIAFGVWISDDTIDDLETIAPVAAAVSTVSANIASVNTVAANVDDVNTTAANISNINAAAANETNINAAVANASNINAVAANEANIDTAATNSANINAVAAIDSDVTTAAANAADIQTVAANIAELAEKLPKDGSAAMAAALPFTELGATPTTPAAGLKLLYPKSDGKLYTLDSAGNEVEVGSGSGAVPSTWITPEDFGAAGDGTTDDYQAFQDAIDAIDALGGGTLMCSAKTYKIDTALVITTDNLVFSLNGATLDFGDVAVGPYIDFTGTVVGTHTLTGDATKGAVSIPLTGADGLGIDAVTMAARLFSEELFDPLRTSSYCGEFIVLSGVSGTGITSIFGLQDSYATADNAQIEVFTPIKNSHLVGPGLVYGNTTSESNVNGVRFLRAMHCSAHGVRFDETDLAHIQVGDSFDCHVRFCYLGVTRPTSQGYGVSFRDASLACSARFNTFYRCRHSLSTNNGTNYGGVPRFIYFEDNQVFNSAQSAAAVGGDAVDTHAAAEFIFIRRNHIQTPSGSGVNIECPNIWIEGNTVLTDARQQSAFYGMLIHNETAREGRAVVRNNTVFFRSNSGIALQAGTGGSLLGYKNIDVSGNTVESESGRSVTAGIRLDACSKGQVTRNNIKMQGTAATERGIYALESASVVTSDIIFAENMVDFDNSTATNKHGIEGVAAADRLGMWNNIVKGNTASDGVITGGGTGSVAANNITS